MKTAFKSIASNALIVLGPMFAVAKFAKWMEKRDRENKTHGHS